MSEIARPEDPLGMTVHAPADPMPPIFRIKPVGSWLAIGTMIFVGLLCWAGFFGFIQTQFEGKLVPSLQADSLTYFQYAGLLPSQFPVNQVPLIGFSANLVGPVLLAKMLRTPFAVVVFNFVLLAVMVRLARQVPGVRRRIFLLLFFMNAESYVAIMTLNKEILAAVGIVGFIASLYVKRGRKLLLLFSCVFSLMARWEQVAILLIFLAMRSRRSPFRYRPKAGLLFLLFLLTFAYVGVVRYSGIDVGGFLFVAQNSGLIAKLDAVQGHFGLPLVIVPKILMNMFNRWLLPTYFISPEYLNSNFYAAQDAFVIHLHTLAMLILVVVAFLQRRLRLAQPIIFLISLYLLITSVNPFIQPRYEFPVYVLFCLLLAIEQPATREVHFRAARLQPASEGTV